MDDGSSSSSSSSMSISATNSTSSNPDSDTKIAKVTKSIISHCTTIFDFTDLTPNEKRRVLEIVTNAFSLATSTPSSSSSKTTSSAATATATATNSLSDNEAVAASASTATESAASVSASASVSPLLKTAVSSVITPHTNNTKHVATTTTKKTKKKKVVLLEPIEKRDSFGIDTTTDRQVSDCLAGLTFVFTGNMEELSRDDAIDLVKRLGGRVTGAVSGKTNYLVIGPVLADGREYQESSKYRKAIAAGGDSKIKLVMGEKYFYGLCHAYHEKAMQENGIIDTNSNDVAKEKQQVVPKAGVSSRSSSTITTTTSTPSSTGRPNPYAKNVTDSNVPNPYAKKATGTNVPNPYAKKATDDSSSAVSKNPYAKNKGPVPNPYVNNKGSPLSNPYAKNKTGPSADVLSNPYATKSANSVNSTKKRHRDDNENDDDDNDTTTRTNDDATSSTSPSVALSESELASSFQTPSANEDGTTTTTNTNNNNNKSNTIATNANDTSTPSLTTTPSSPFKRAKIFSDSDDNSGEETSRSHKKSSSSNSSSSNSSDNISSNSNNSSNNNKGSLLSTLGPKTQRTSSTTTTTTAPDKNNVSMTSRTNNKLTVARFLIQNLRGGRGYATTDYYIDLIKEKHGLYDLVSTIYDILQKKNLSHDSIMSHLWDVEFAGIVYKNGWRHRNMDGTYDRSMVKYDIDEGEPRILSSLATPLEQGQQGICSGESATFYILVQSISLEKVDEDKICVKIASPFSWECKEDDKKASLPQYPKITSVELNISSSVEDDWISVAEKTKCINVQRSWNNYFRGENSWKRDERILNVFYPRKPQYPQWNNDEITIIALLLKSDAKFKKSWTNILQYTFVNRSESATSMKWYQLKGKESFKIEHTGRGLTNDARIRLVKRLAKKRMMGLLEKGCPTKDPHPDEVVEAKLRKRGLINDDTSKTEKMKLFSQYRHLYY